MNMATRPKSLKEVAEQSESLREFGLNLRDWLHELRRISSRSQAIAAVSEEPRDLRINFPRVISPTHGSGHTLNTWLERFAGQLRLGPLLRSVLRRTRSLTKGLIIERCVSLLWRSLPWPSSGGIFIRLRSIFL